MKKNKETIAKQVEYDCKKGLESFAFLLKKQRSSAKYSMTELYELSGVSSSTINDIEKAKYMPRIDVLFKLGYALNLSKSEILEALKGFNLNANYKDSVSTTIKTSLSGYGACDQTVQEILDFINFKFERDGLEPINFYK